MNEKIGWRNVLKWTILAYSIALLLKLFRRLMRRKSRQMHIRLYRNGYHWNQDIVENGRTVKAQRPAYFFEEDD